VKQLTKESFMEMIALILILMYLLKDRG